MFYFWRGATAALVPGFLSQSGRRRPENVSILSSLLVNVNDNSSIQDYVYSDDETQPTFEMTPRFKPFTW